MNSFPQKISLTLTNKCNLRCKMCGQWSETGYMKTQKAIHQTMKLDDWKRVIDEIDANGIDWVLLRGGEVFLLDYIMDLLKYIESKNITIFIDTKWYSVGKIC